MHQLFCYRKPEAVIKMTPELLFAVLRNTIFTYAVYCTVNIVHCTFSSPLCWALSVMFRLSRGKVGANNDDSGNFPFYNVTDSLVGMLMKNVTGNLFFYSPSHCWPWPSRPACGQFWLLQHHTERFQSKKQTCNKKIYYFFLTSWFIVIEPVSYLTRSD